MLEILATALAICAALAWIALLSLRGRFWRNTLLPEAAHDRESWPEVVALVPARNEAETIEAAVGSLLDQDYPGRLSVIVVDVGRGDDTAALARAAGDGRARDLEIVSGENLPEGWQGKVWALEQGARRAAGQCPHSRYFWLSDADIRHDPGNLRRLIAKAEADWLDLASLMVMLNCEGFWGRLLIPPFVFFFRKLYPFAWVNDPARRTAAAAGGCV
ncbi:MAG: glycosyltransferase, partial [Rhodovibrionaceae bacterium]|nr:glycosyltransferase [Rhodovibrionaceae bacterium]